MIGGTGHVTLIATGGNNAATRITLNASNASGLTVISNVTNGTSMSHILCPKQANTKCDIYCDGDDACQFGMSYVFFLCYLNFIFHFLFFILVVKH